MISFSEAIAKLIDAIPVPENGTVSIDANLEEYTTLQDMCRKYREGKLDTKEMPCEHR